MSPASINKSPLKQSFASFGGAGPQSSSDANAQSGWMKATTSSNASAASTSRANPMKQRSVFARTNTAQNSSPFQSPFAGTSAINTQRPPPLIPAQSNKNAPSPMRNRTDVRRTWAHPDINGGGHLKVGNRPPLGRGRGTALTGRLQNRLDRSTPTSPGANIVPGMKRQRPPSTRTGENISHQRLSTEGIKRPGAASQVASSLRRKAIRKQQQVSPRTSSSGSSLKQPLATSNEQMDTDLVTDMQMHAYKHKTHKTETVSQTKAQQAMLRRQVAAELRILIGRQCDTDHEKYELLKQRDDILRKLTVKSANVNRATVFCGSCAEMCPEKERYRRIVQKALSSYECTNGVIDHMLCVKEYSRSSADQEEPLPHELRASSVLSDTMHYLIDRIASNPPPPESPDKLVIWYDFLWSRTRAIRKELSQQMLMDACSVHLVECCARLHIFAGYYLCELGAGDFSQKLCTEHLNKSLMSLSQMYDDLLLKGVLCPNEPEFRAYEILLNFDDSNRLRQVLTYPTRVSQSEAVRVAVNVFLANQHNNYVRLFKLVLNQMDCLQLCLMHRHLPNIRGRALQSLTFSCGMAQQSMSMCKVASLLAVPDTLKMTELAACYGLSTAGADGSLLILDKTSFFWPESAPALERCDSLMSSKIGNKNIGHILNGAALQSLPLIQAANSFDDTQRYDGSDPVIQQYLSDQPQALHTNNRFECSGQSASSTVNVNAPVADQELMSHLAVLTMRQAIQECIRSEMGIAFVHVRSEQVMHSLLDETVQEEVLLSAHAALQEATETEHKERELARTAAYADWLTRMSDCLYDWLLDSTSQSLIETYSERALYSAVLNKHAQYLDTVATQMCEEFWHCLIEWQSERLIQQVYSTDVQQVLQHLAHIQHRLQLCSVRSAFNRWLARTRRSVKRTKSLHNFPVGPCAEHRLSGVYLPCQSGNTHRNTNILASGQFAALMHQSADCMQTHILMHYGAQTYEQWKLFKANCTQRRLRRYWNQWRYVIGQRSRCKQWGNPIHFEHANNVQPLSGQVKRGRLSNPWDIQWPVVQENEENHTMQSSAHDTSVFMSTAHYMAQTHHSNFVSSRLPHRANTSQHKSSFLTDKSDFSTELEKLNFDVNVLKVRMQQDAIEIQKLL